ncbi:recA/RAD51 family protein [Coprinopsis cinerea okayama7|uniref:RecA/RAD51 family protein n=1 Tax=Coprinopsis cinerea (strain Okayama-7 / 130 / ATCC MYA-4618 / FGSC 9003) TaxID=240176 RepID=A8N1S0_COPC7|nr:recA/RAD51 family protein [Coprinopsis cinerea okayama7\|eukprot:XP_001828812.1 recA/RAD51 family protein [Coprinopsis cinerea okayama7\
MPFSAHSIIDQVHEESLLNLLTSVASQGSTGPATAIPALDAYCSAANISYRGNILEIQGPPASGKTSLIYFAITTCILPPIFHSVRLGGWGKIVFLFDMDSVFDIIRLKDILLHRLSSTSLVPNAFSTLVAMSLARLCILRPNSTQQLAVSLANIQKIMSTRFPNQELGIVIVDSLSSFYWPDRFISERTALNKQTLNPLKHVIHALQCLRISLAPFVILSNWGLIPLEQTEDPVLYRQHLTPYYPDTFSEAPEGYNQPRSTSNHFIVDLHITTAPSLQVPGSFVGYIRSAASNQRSRMMFRVTAEGIHFA